ncbi:copper resistance protein CopC [Nocardioides humi]|uniref:Copper resistance protein CopC n=1 Tax=Nocardioides humi TaxID=449461 RepID=A0ABN2AAY1_9ACTN|nr:copper resistance protein CopC [Nocardioides humi]
MGRAGRAAGAALLLALAVLLLLPAAPAAAHATLIATDPAAGAVLPAAPDRVRFTFDEKVSLVPDGVRVFDAAGDPVASSATARDAVLEVDLPDEVGTGTLVVVWRVVSADGHPISGSLAFSVGAPSEQVVAVPVPDSGPTGPPLVSSIATWAGYVSLLLTAGLVAFVVLFVPEHHLADRARDRLVRSSRIGAGIAIVAWLAEVPLTAVYQVGAGVGALAKGSTWASLDRLEYVVAGVVSAGLVLAVVLLGRGLVDRTRRLVALAACALAACAPALTGHTRGVTPEALAVGADMLHLVAGSIWLGGLVALVLVLPDLGGRGALAAEVLARFSVVAAGVLAALAVTGVLLAWRIAGSWDVLFSTGYGRLLLVKIGAAAVAVLIACWNRFVLLPRLRDAAHRRDRRTGAGMLARSTAAEAVVLVAVLLLTGFLVDRSPEAAPAASAAGAGGPAGSGGPVEPAVRSVRMGHIEVRATLSSPRPGRGTVRVELLDVDGRPTEAFEAPRLRLAGADVDLGAVPVDSVAPGVYSGPVVIPTAGTWRLQVSLRLGEFENPVSVLEFPVEAG